MNIAPLEELNPHVLSSAVALFPPHPAVSFNVLERRDFLAQAAYVGANPPYGATIDYYMDAPATDARLRITTSDGRLVRELKVPATPGLHRVIWDLRLAPPPQVPRPTTPDVDTTHARPAESTLARIPGDYGGGGDPTGGEAGGELPKTLGPTVLPGHYTVTLTAGGHRERELLFVQGDPRVHATARDRQQQYRFLFAVYEAQESSGPAITAVRALHESVSAVTKAIGALTAPPAAAKQAAADFAKTVADLQRDLGRAASGIGRLGGSVARSTSRPTVAQETALADTMARLKSLVDQLNGTIATGASRLNQQLEAAGVPSTVPRVKAPAPVKWMVGGGRER